MMKGWKLRLLRLLALLIIVCVGAAACSKKDNDTAQEPFTVKLGVLLDFSGDKRKSPRRCTGLFHWLSMR